MLTKTRILISPLLVFALLLSACTQAQIVTDLDIAAAAAAAVAAVPGIPPGISAQISQAVIALDCVTAAVEKGGTSVQVSTSIAACGLTAVSTNVPSGTGATIIAVLTALNAAIAKVLIDNKAVTAEIRSYETSMANSFADKAAPAKTYKLGHGDKAKISKIRKSLADTKAKLPAKAQ